MRVAMREDVLPRVVHSSILDAKLLVNCECPTGAERHGGSAFKMSSAWSKRVDLNAPGV